MVLAGAGVAWWMYGRQPVPETAPAGGPLTVAARESLYGDAVNESLFMRPGQYLTRFLVFFDNRIIDGFVNGFAAVVGGISSRGRRTQTGFARSYAMSMFVGAAVGHARCRAGEDLMAWLTVLGAVPLVGAAVVAVLPKGRDLLAKQIALAVSLVVLALTVAMALQFDADGPTFQFGETHEWIPAFGISYSVGVDGIALVLIAMATVLVPARDPAPGGTTPTTRPDRSRSTSR